MSTPQHPSAVSSFPALAQSRVYTARQVEGFDPEAVRRQLMDSAGSGQAPFMIVGQLARPTADTWFDACTDGETLYVTVLCWEAGESYGLASSPAEAGVGANSIEVIFAPYGDGIGYLHFGVGPGTDAWFTHHWPYHETRPDLVSRPQWEVTWQYESLREEKVWAAYFRFPVSTITDPAFCGPLGFNIMRTQMRTTENAAWSHCSGSGFPDATGMGWLRLSEETPMPKEIAWCDAPPVPGYQLQGTYDWPDEMTGGPYTPAQLRKEILTLKQHGMDRLYWIDYPFSLRMLDDVPFNKTTQVNSLDHFIREHLRRTVEAFGGDPLPVVAALAHEAGLEFFTVIKPYDLWCYRRAPLSETQFANFPRTLGGYAATIDPFIAAHPEYAFRRNPAWTQAPGMRKIDEIVLFADSPAPLPFDPKQLVLYAGDDNVTYTRCEQVEIVEEVVTRPRYRWTPAGKISTGGEERVQAIHLIPRDLTAGYLAVEFPAFTAPGAFGNQQYLLTEVQTADGVTAVTLTNAQRNGDYRQRGFEFQSQLGAGGWADFSEGMLFDLRLQSGSVLGIALGQDSHYVGMLEPGFPEVRAYWLREYVARAIAAGADGVDVRIAHHQSCAEWLSYAFAEPNLAVFRQRFGREPEANAVDFAAIRRIRGEFHTQFLREAAATLHAAGKKLEAHLESRMTTPADFDTSNQIHWDYATWIDDGIVDGINLKYLGPFNSFVQREILPRTRRRGIPVHLIGAISDPRSNPRAPEFIAQAQAMAQVAGLNGIDLYELWCYFRTTPRGEWLPRGCAMAVLEQLAKNR